MFFSLLVNLVFDFPCICMCMCSLRFAAVRNAPHQTFLSVDDFSGSWHGKLKDLLYYIVLVLQWSQRGKGIRQKLFKVWGWVLVGSLVWFVFFPTFLRRYAICIWKYFTSTVV